MTNEQFMECDTCRAKPGSPTLCGGCLHNRRVIEALTGRTQTRFPDEPKAPDFRALLEEAWKAADGNEGDHVLGSDLNERIKSALNLLAEPKGCQLQNARVCAEWPACVCGRTLGSVVNREGPHQ
jgi:hypothetical protein